MDSEQIREIYLRHADEMYRTARIYLRNPADAEDAVSEVFCRYLKKRPVFNDADHEKAWFLRVTINYCKDELRSAWKRRVDMRELPDVAAPEGDRQREQILEAVYALPEDQRILVLLYYYEGYRLREIADITGTSESTLQSRLFRARAQLKMRMEDEQDA